jgi:hypothetical protein
MVLDLHAEPERPRLTAELEDRIAGMQAQAGNL